MQLNTALYNLFRKKAETVTVEILCVGLRYTVVCTSDGGIGIAFTDLGGQHSCLPAKVYQDPEGLPAIQLLE
ncbi:MAG: DUF4213 domain-containing protein, partial [Deltaproteobacteria bacterium]|nr:DUF4213 domain-containing protein [Deltaproteobacteria bacterium]